MSKKLIFTLLFSLIIFSAKSNLPFSTQYSAADGFPLSVENTNTIVFCDSTEQEVVKIAAKLFCSDVEMITGRKPKLTHSLDSLTENVVIIGSKTNSQLIKQLVTAGKLNIDSLVGGWERFLVQTIDAPIAGVSKALVIAGSDRRGTAYGVFEVSKSMGVSPWYWWADVTPKKQASLILSPIAFVSNEPTVKYRGIFINDEDWGLQEWSQYTFDPVKDIGPRTYEKVFELLLRLKANYIWPAMHPSTKPFNYYAENKIVADRFAIIMGASHHEPLLYNTYEWPYPVSEWNPFISMEKIMGELEKRVASNGMYENLYTVGIRATEDGGMAGGSTLNEKTAKLEEVISRERQLLTKYVNPDVQKVPQVFWPYKEVLEQYNNNMNVPDDITLGWVDDNHGYIRQVSNPTEQTRSGGSGVYYHISYWGLPNDYLWLASTSPALIASEMKKAATFGGNRVWMFNVGDIKPEEMLTNYCLDLAWDYNKWGTDNVREYLLEWSEYTFGQEYAEDITNAYTKYFQLAQAGKPEHVNVVSFSESEIEARIASYTEISDIVESVYTRIPTELKDAFFETVYYPIVCAGLMNKKFFYANKSFKGAIEKDPKTLEYSLKAISAYNNIQNHTNHYNTAIKNGKWNKVISCDIRDQSVYDMPAVATQTDINKEHIEFPIVDLSKGTFVAPLKFANGAVVGNNVRQTETTGGSALFAFNMPKSTASEIYFYVKTPSLNEDSWFLNINGTKLVQNDFVTGENFDWVKVWSGNLPAGRNTITINQREPNAVIAAIKIIEPGLYQYKINVVQNPDTVIPAYKFSTMQNALGYQWKVIDGLSSSEKAVTNLPYTLPSVSDVKSAPYIESEVELNDTSFTVEIRCMPTKKLYEGRDLRFGISINDGEPQVFSIHQYDLTGTWNKNVLRGYTKNVISYSSNSHTLKIRLYALDPGVIFDKVLIYNNSAKDGASNPNDIIQITDEQLVRIYPNPCSNYLTISLDKSYDEELELQLTDLNGQSMLNKKVRIHKNSNNIEFPVSNLVNGTYLLTLTGRNCSITRKVLVQK